MQKAIDGWVEDRPGTEHEAFLREDSPTRALRYAQVRVKGLRLHEVRAEVGATMDRLSLVGRELDAQVGSPREELQRVAGLVREMLGCGWEMTAAKRARLLSVLAILRAKSSNDGASRFAAAALRVFERPARIIFLLGQSKNITRNTYNEQMKPAVISFAQALTRHAKGVWWGAVAHAPVHVLQTLTPDLNCFTAAIESHSFKAESTQIAKALKKTLELTRADLGNSEPDPLCLVFNFVCSGMDSVKDAQKAFRRLDAENVIVASVAVGPAEIQDLQQSSSPGLAFGVADLADLHRFLGNASTEMENVLSEAQKLENDEVLRRLDDFG